MKHQQRLEGIVAEVVGEIGEENLTRLPSDLAKFALKVARAAYTRGRTLERLECEAICRRVALEEKDRGSEICLARIARRR